MDDAIYVLDSIAEPATAPKIENAGRFQAPQITSSRSCCRNVLQPELPSQSPSKNCHIDIISHSNSGRSNHKLRKDREIPEDPFSCIGIDITFLPPCLTP